jgi:NTP pyrophosphatase (non-canonical NTP hydrolase)
VSARVDGADPLGLRASADLSGEHTPRPSSGPRQIHGLADATISPLHSIPADVQVVRVPLGDLSDPIPWMRVYVDSPPVPSEGAAGGGTLAGRITSVDSTEPVEHDATVHIPDGFYPGSISVKGLLHYGSVSALSADSLALLQDRRTVWDERFLSAIEPPLTPAEIALRFLEEAMELAQAAGVTELSAASQLRRTYSREIGDVPQEAADCMTNLLGVANAFAFDLSAMTLSTLERIEDPVVSARIAARQTEKRRSLAEHAAELTEKPQLPAHDVIKAGMAVLAEARRQNPDVWNDWLAEEELPTFVWPDRAGLEHDRHPWRFHSQHEPLDALEIAKAVLATLRPVEAPDDEVRFSREIALPVDEDEIDPLDEHRPTASDFL